MEISRRAMLAALAAMGGARQGIAPRNVKPQPRGKPSGRPFHARFTDVAKRGRPAPHPVDLRRRRHQEATSSKPSAAASRSSTTTTTAGSTFRPERHAPRRRAARRHQPPVQEQPRRHVHRRHREGRPDAHRLGLGGHRRRLQQRRLRRSVHHLLGPERALSQQRRRHVHRCHREGRPSPERACARARAAPWSTTTATATSTCSSPTT